MNWSMLIAEEQLMEIDLLSEQNGTAAVVILKHSTRCGISSMALSRLERSWSLPAGKVPVYFLDLLKYRELSAEIAVKYGVEHQSPQILVIKKGKCIYSASHSEISVPDIESAITNN
jgi:monothiol bacilliredoxin